MRALALALVALLCASVSSAAPPPDLVEVSRQIQGLAAPRGAESESARLARLFELYWDARMREFPDLATYVGYPGLKDRWPDRSPETIALIRRITRQELAALASIDRARLTAAEQVNYDLARRRLERQIEGERFHELEPFRSEYLLISQLHGIDLGLMDLRGYLPARTVADYETMLALLRGFPQAAGQTLVHAWYAFQLRGYTTTDLTPGEIHRLGLSEVRRIRAEMDQVIAATGFAGSFADSLAGGVPGWFLVNTYDLASRPKWAMEALALHESVPGHHLQYALVEELGELPDWRKWDVYPAFSEGWALYAEGLGEEIGLYQDPYSKFGQLTNETWRAIRLVADTGLHTLGWSRQQAIDYYLANSAKTEHDVETEVDRVIAQPGTVPVYKIGELKIRELRRHAERELRESFDLRAFHDHLLGHGQLPLDLLETSVKAWVAEAKAASAP